MKRVWLAIAVSLICYCLVDILIWQRIFEDQLRYGMALREQVVGYQIAWQLVLAGLVLVGSIGFWKEKLKMLFFAGATTALAHSGLEDVLYYWLDGRQIPDLLPWLDQAPLIIKYGTVTRFQLLASTEIWLAFWLVMTVVMAAVDDG